MTQVTANEGEEKPSTMASATSVVHLPRRFSSRQVHLSFRGALRSEFVKVFSLKSTWIVLILDLIALPGLAYLVALSGAHDYSPKKYHDGIVPAADFWDGITTFVSLSTLLVGIFAVLAICSEFTSSSINSSLTVNPRRTMFLAAKAVVVGFCSWFVNQVGVLLAFAFTSFEYSSIPVDQQSGSTLLPVLSILGAPLATACFAVLALGVGSICRSTTGGMFAFVGIEMILPLVVIPLSSLSFLKGFTWLQNLPLLIPTRLLDTFLSGNTKHLEDVNFSGPNWWQAGLLMVLWAAVFYAIGAWVMNKRDIK